MIDWHQKDGKRKLRRRRESACQISDEHDGDHVITQACTATSGTKLLVFVDDVT